MPTEVRASPTELGRAAQLSLTESMSLFDVLRAARDNATLPAELLGNSSAAPDTATAHAEVVEAAGTAVERLIAVLEHDVEALYQLAFAYQLADQQAAAAFSQHNPAVPF